MNDHQSEEINVSLDKNNSEIENNNSNSTLIPPKQLTYVKRPKTSHSGKILIGLGISFAGILLDNSWLGVIGSIVAFSLALVQVIPYIIQWIRFFSYSSRKTNCCGGGGFNSRILDSV